MVGDEVRVVYRKYDESRHWNHPMRRLGEDRHGVWLGAGPGAASFRGDDSPVISGQARVVLLPYDGWWTAWFNDQPDAMEIYCDVNTPVQWPHPDTVTMVDLDLDVCRWRTDRRVELLDEDEFAEHQVRYRYPREVIARATETAAWLHAALGNGTEPFATEYLAWLAQAADGDPGR